MSKVTCDMAVSTDGFAAGPNQGPDKPFGDGPVDRLTKWMLEQPESYTGRNESMSRLREEHGIMASLVQHPTHPQGSVVTENPMHLP